MHIDAIPKSIRRVNTELTDKEIDNLNPKVNTEVKDKEIEEDNHVVRLKVNSVHSNLPVLPAGYVSSSSSSCDSFSESDTATPQATPRVGPQPTIY